MPQSSSNWALTSRSSRSNPDIGIRAGSGLETIPEGSESSNRSLDSLSSEVESHHVLMNQHSSQILEIGASLRSVFRGSPTDADHL